MNAKTFSDAMGELDLRYVDEAAHYRKRTGAPVWMRWGAAAACVCLLAVGGVLITKSKGRIAPNPDMVQVINPIITVDSVEEMERYLDYSVPTLEKEVGAYSVLVVNRYPTMGQIRYADGSEFRIKYGSGDISGIYGGKSVENRVIEGVNVGYYQYTDITYAIWEQKGFTFSYIYTDGSAADVETLIRLFQSK